MSKYNLGLFFWNDLGLIIIQSGDKNFIWLEIKFFPHENNWSLSQTYRGLLSITWNFNNEWNSNCKVVSKMKFSQNECEKINNMI